MRRDVIYTTLGISMVVGAGYIFYRSWKEYKKEQNREEISAYEIKVKKELDDEMKKREEILEDEDEEEEVEDLDLEYTVDFDEINIAPSEEDDYHEDEEIEEVEDEDEEEDVVIGYLEDEKEGEILRHEPNSKEALAQFKAMVLSDYEENETLWDILNKLWGYSYNPRNTADATVKKHLFEAREEFFGEDSKWNEQITFAEVVIFFGNKLAWDFDVDIIGCTKIIVDAIELDGTSGDTKITNTIADLVSHDFVSKDQRYGLFGLALEDYREHILNYPSVKVTVNSDVSFNMEYDVFCNVYSDDILAGF